MGRCCHTKQTGTRGQEVDPKRGQLYIVACELIAGPPLGNQAAARNQGPHNGHEFRETFAETDAIVVVVVVCLEPVAPLPMLLARGKLLQ